MKNKKKAQSVILVLLLVFGSCAMGANPNEVGPPSTGSDLAKNLENAKAGNASAQYQIGMALKDGSADSVQQAALWFKRAALQNDHRSMFELSRLLSKAAPSRYADPVNVAQAEAWKDIGYREDSSHWMEKAALRGNLGAIALKCILGADDRAPLLMRQEGQVWCHVGAELTNENSDIHRQMVESGEKTALFYSFAKHVQFEMWVRDSLKKNGIPVRGVNLADVVINDRQDDSMRLVEVLSGHEIEIHFEKMVEQGKYKEAQELCNMSKDVSCATLAFQLASLHRVGNMVEQNANRALFWFLYAALHGNSTAQLNVAILLSLGEGTPSDGIKSYAFATYAKRNGNSGASDILKILEPKLSKAHIEAGIKYISTIEAHLRPSLDAKQELMKLVSLTTLQARFSPKYGYLCDRVGTEQQKVQTALEAGATVESAIAESVGGIMRDLETNDPAISSTLSAVLRLTSKQITNVKRANPEVVYLYSASQCVKMTALNEVRWVQPKNSGKFTEGFTYCGDHFNPDKRKQAENIQCLTDKVEPFVDVIYARTPE